MTNQKLIDLKQPAKNDRNLTYLRNFYIYKLNSLPEHQLINNYIDINTLNNNLLQNLTRTTTSALMLIDIQFADEESLEDEIYKLEAIKTLLITANNWNIPVIIVELETLGICYPTMRQILNTIEFKRNMIDENNNGDNFYYFVKKTQGLFEDEEIKLQVEKVLAKNSINNIVLGGSFSGHCVMDTAKGLLQRNMIVTTSPDLTISLSNMPGTIENFYINKTLTLKDHTQILKLLQLENGI